MDWKFGAMTNNIYTCNLENGKQVTAMIAIAKF